MDAFDSHGPLHATLLHLPILTTFFAAFFSFQLFSRYREKGGGPHLLWWGIGMVTYGIGTFTEAYTTLFGWQPFVFRSWYVAGAFLGGYPLAQGSIYLLMSRRFADGSARVVCGVIALGAVFVFLTPLDLSLVETHRLSGKVIEWSWIRMMTPFINLYSVAFLAGGAALSAWRFFRAPEMRNRYVGNMLIAVGAILPGIGGTATRFGYVEVLYVTELVGLLLIFAGYRKCVAAPRPMVAQLATATHVFRTLALALVAVVLSAAPARANDEASAEDADATERPSFFARTTVTATGSEVDTFDVTTPVTVISAEEIELRAPYNASDLLRAEPGVDVNGVGPNQARPIIRGQRGLRVLFLENGLRMNNARRQSDFGEIPGLVDLDTVEAVEVVRGPASVLYGSDAIGGVLNLVTRNPQPGRSLAGTVALRGSSADEQQRVQAALGGRTPRRWWNVGVSYRDVESYDAPSGSFGDLTLAEDTAVVDTGIQDDTLHALFGFQLAEKHSLSLRYNRYRADETGFGFIEPAALGESDPFRIRILYPFQDFDRVQLSWLGSALDSPLADSVDFKLYSQSNERELVNDIDDILIGPIFPGAPDSSIDIDTSNFTDLDTLGLRLETVKLAGEKHLVTYGLEAYEDESFNTDFSETTVFLRFPFPPNVIEDVTVDDVANAPNATNTSYGVFVQDEILLSDRLKVTLGARYQQVETKAEATPGWEVAGLDFEDDAVVGTATVLYGASQHLNLLASYGTAFRAPNIIERLFNGVTPEGSGYQILNPDLESEASDNVDLGIKYQRRNAYLEATLFRTEIDDGIIQDFLSPGEIAALPPDVRQEIGSLSVVVQQRNVERLRYEGVEVAVGYRSDAGLELGANYTHLDAQRIDNTQPPTGDTFSDKWNGFVRYRPRGGRYWLEYRLRHNASTDANVDPDEPLPLVGAELPSFTVHTVAGGVALAQGDRFEHHLGVIVDNVTDELYAEFSNASFFRPQPGRNVTATYRLRF